MFKDKPNQTLTVYAYDVNGFPVEGEANNILGFVSLDDGPFTQLYNEHPEEQDQSGYYIFDLLQAETIADKLTFDAVCTTPGVIVDPVPRVTYTIVSDVLLARVSNSYLVPNRYLVIIQEEEKGFTFVVEGNSRFDNPTPSIITVTVTDVTGFVITIEDSDIVRLLEDWELQVFRIVLSSANTASLAVGLLSIEISIDSQKAVLTHSVKVEESL